MARTEQRFISMSDGVRLAATLYFPEDAGPWPALLEALPYRKDDVTASYRPEYVRLAAAGWSPSIDRGSVTASVRAASRGLRRPRRICSPAHWSEWE